jgi:hypothetical protein
VLSLLAEAAVAAAFRFSSTLMLLIRFGEAVRLRGEETPPPPSTRRNEWSSVTSTSEVRMASLDSLLTDPR